MRCWTMKRWSLSISLTYRAISSSDLSSDLAVFNDVSPPVRRVSQNPEFLPALWNSLRFKKDLTKLPGRGNPSLTDVLDFQDSRFENIMMLLKIIWNVSCIRPSRTGSFCRSGSSQRRITQRAVGMESMAILSTRPAHCTSRKERLRIKFAG